MELKVAFEGSTCLKERTQWSCLTAWSSFFMYRGEELFLSHQNNFQHNSEMSFMHFDFLTQS